MKYIDSLTDGLTTDYVLVKFDSDWADEYRNDVFHATGFCVFPTNQFKLYIELLKQVKHEDLIKYEFRPDEYFLWRNIEEYVEYLKPTKSISYSTAMELLRLFGTAFIHSAITEFGIFPDMIQHLVSSKTPPRKIPPNEEIFDAWYGEEG